MRAKSYFKAFTLPSISAPKRTLRQVSVEIRIIISDGRLDCKGRGGFFPVPGDFVRRAGRKRAKEERAAARSSQLVEKGPVRRILCKSLAEFRRPQTTESSANLFFPGTCASEKTLLSPQACALRACDAVGCNPSSTCLHVRERLSTLSTASEERAAARSS